MTSLSANQGPALCQALRWSIPKWRSVFCYWGKKFLLTLRTTRSRKCVPDLAYELIHMKVYAGTTLVDAGLLVFQNGLTFRVDPNSTTIISPVLTQTSTIAFSDAAGMLSRWKQDLKWFKCILDSSHARKILTHLSWISLFLKTEITFLLTVCSRELLPRTYIELWCFKSLFCCRLP